MNSRPFFMVRISNLFRFQRFDRVFIGGSVALDGNSQNRYQQDDRQCGYEYPETQMSLVSEMSLPLDDDVISYRRAYYETYCNDFEIVVIEKMQYIADRSAEYFTYADLFAAVFYLIHD